MSTCSTHYRVTGSDQTLDGDLGGYCRGLVPQVSWVTNYNPKFWIQPVPSSDKRLGNHTTHTGYGPTAPG
jgi:hypothetical protein